MHIVSTARETRRGIFSTWANSVQGPVTLIKFCPVIIVVRGDDGWLFCICSSLAFYDSARITSDNVSPGVERCRRDVVRVICRCVAALHQQWRTAGYGGK